MLRAIVRSDGMFEVLANPPHYTITSTDLSQAAPGQAARTLDIIHESLLSRRRPLDSWPLYDVQAVHMPDGTTRLMFAFCTMIFGATGWYELERDINALYRDLDARLPAISRSYSEYVAAVTAGEHGVERRRALAYWEDRVPMLPPGPALPSPRRPGPKRWFHSEFRLPQRLITAFKQTARTLGLSKSSLALAAFAEVVATWSKSRHFVLTQLVEARPREFNSVYGNYCSTLALEVDFRGGRTFRERARDLHRRFLQDLEHRAVSGIHVGRELNRLNGSRPKAMFPVAFASFWSSADDGTKKAKSQTSCLGRYVRRRLRVPDITIDVGMVEHSDGSVVCNFDARGDLFPDGFLDDLESAFHQILVDLAERPEIADQVRACPIPQRDRALIVDLNRTAGPQDGRLLHELFLEQAGRDPDATAVISEERKLSYGELERSSRELAHRLRALGVGPNQLVAVPMERGWQQVVAVLAIHRAGAAYVPIDLALVPHERMLHILEHAEIRVAITQPESVAAVDWPENFALLTVEDEETDDVGELEPRLQKPEDVAYVIYTSGSTGLPKGVVIDHRGAVNTVLDINRRFDITARDRVLALSSLGFDLSVWDIFGTFAAGGVLVMPPALERPDPTEWAKAARTHGVTIWNSVPKLLEIMIENIGERTELWPSTIRLAMLSGDWIPTTLPDRARALSSALEIISLGGATEASIWSNFFPIATVDPAWPSIPYGRPLTNQTMYVLDDALAHRPIWVVGELYIGGIGVAHGYWRDDEKTAARFVTHPLTGERLYRTGDLGRYLPDGNIEFLGREDSQIKVRGYRVELGEIEAVIGKLPNIREAYVLAREASTQRARERRRRASDASMSGSPDRSAEKQLVAYVIPERETLVDVTYLRSQVAAKLPDYMVPTFFVVLQTADIPRSANGKVNRRQLPAPVELQSHRTVQAPADALETSLLALFTRVLGVPDLGVDDSFFELGGDSVMLVRVLSHIRQEHGREISVAAFALDPRVSSIARLLRQAPSDHANERSLIALRPEGQLTPLFLVHPVGGSGLAYLALAQRIERARPIYAVQARGLETDAPPRTAVDEMAKAYIAEIKSVQPQGPYLLGGWSLGGVVAFEMACQLRALGEVARVLMIDSWAPQGSVGEQVSLPDEMMLQWFRRDLNGISGLARGTREIVMGREGASPTMRRQFAVYSANVRAARSYVPQTSPVPVALIRAATVAFTFGLHPALRNPALDDPMLGWRPLVQRPIEVDSVPGDHYSILAPERIEQLAMLVSQLVRRLEHGET